MKMSRLFVAVGVAGALIVAGAATGTPLGAQTNPIHTDPNAALTITAPGSDTVVLHAAATSLFDGSYDDTSGALTGTLVLDGGTTTISGTPLGDDAQVTAFFTTGSAISNGLVAADGTVSFDDTLTLEFFEFTIDGHITDVPGECATGPVDLHYVGTHDAATGRITATAGPVAAPRMAAGSCDELSSAIAAWLDDATLSMQVDFGVRVDDAVGPTTTTPDAGTSLSTINADGIVSQGCTVTVPITFGEGGRYTLEVTTVDGHVVDSVPITRNAGGLYDIHLTIDLGPDAHVGDRINFTLRDIDGNRIATASSTVADPTACLTTPHPRLTAPAATAAHAAPTFTG